MGFSKVWCCCISLAIEFVLHSMQIVVLGPYTIIAHSPRFFLIPIAKKLKLISFELEEGEIPPYSDLARGLEQALGCILQLEAMVHSEHQSQLAAWLLKQPTNKSKVSSTPSNSC